MRVDMINANIGYTDIISDIFNVIIGNQFSFQLKKNA